MQDFCQTCIIFKNVASYLLFARTFQDMFNLQDFSWSVISAGNSQAIYFLQESCKMTLICEKIARYLSFERMSPDIYYLQTFCLYSIICKNFIRTSRFLMECNICRKLASYLFFARILQDDSYLRENCKISIIWKNVARYLLFANILPVFYYL